MICDIYCIYTASSTMSRHIHPCCGNHILCIQVYPVYCMVYDAALAMSTVHHAYSLLLQDHYILNTMISQIPCSISYHRSDVTTTSRVSRQLVVSMLCIQHAYTYTASILQYTASILQSIVLTHAGVVLSIYDVMRWSGTAPISQRSYPQQVYSSCGLVGILRAEQQSCYAVRQMQLTRIHSSRIYAHSLLLHYQQE